MTDTIKEYIRCNRQLMLDTLRELCAIPAPSHKEYKRAEYCKDWLERAGARGVYIDGALNVIFPLFCEGSDRITVFCAHTDTVFPDLEPMPYFDDGERIHCPGASDDTASVVVLMLMAKFFVERGIRPEGGLMFVCNSCEEGLGNLKGTRQLFRDFSGRIRRFISLDSTLDTVADRCVGSHRYRVEVETEGGHSYGAFGNPNAIAALAGIVSEIYAIRVPCKEGTRTTYNVGEIVGGTSVNTIAQSAEMLCEYRSDDAECLALMQARFREIFERADTEGVSVRVTLVGDRPCGGAATEADLALREAVVPIIEEVIGRSVVLKSSSTDCNIPASLGVPALCIGANDHAGVHTREEWVEKESLATGLLIAIRTGMRLTEVEK